MFKIKERLHVEQLKPELNKQVEALQAHLFNKSPFADL